MEYLDKLLDMADAEFAAVSKSGRFRSRDDIDTVYKLIDIVKDVYCVWDMEDGSSERSYRDDYSRYDGISYARGRGRNAPRDRMGRYTSRGDSYRSMDGGKDEFIHHLHELMENAPDDLSRQNIQNMIEQMEHG